MNTAVIELATPGAIVRFCRQQAGLTQLELALALGKKRDGQATVSEWESGKQNLAAEALLEIIELCGFEFTITAKQEEAEEEDTPTFDISDLQPDGNP